MKKIIYFFCLSMLTLPAYADNSKPVQYQGYEDCFIHQMKEQCKKEYDQCMDASVTSKNVRDCSDKDDACWDRVDTSCKSLPGGKSE